MIVILFNESGYYISGEGVEASRRFSPATTIEGDRIFPPLHHTYRILYEALIEIRNKSSREDIMIYSDSRIIDELNGVIAPLDEVCAKWVQSIQRNILPQIKAVVFFRKKPVNEDISTAHEKMIPKQRPSLPEQQDLSQQKKRETVKRFKENWFNE